MKESNFDRMLKRKETLEKGVSINEFIDSKKTIMLDDSEIEPSYTNGLEKELYLIPFYMRMGEIASVEWALYIQNGIAYFIWNAQGKRNIANWWRWDWSMDTSKAKGLEMLMGEFKQKPTISLAVSILETVVKEIKELAPNE